MPQRQSSRPVAPYAKVRAAALALSALQREAASQPAVSLVTAGDAHAGKVDLLPGFKQNQQLLRSGEGCNDIDDEGSADEESGDVDVASGVVQRLGSAGIRRFGPRGDHENSPFRG